MLTRRQFTAGCGALAFAGLASSALGKSASNATLAAVKGYGPLLKDPNEILDLPKGFSYQVISELGDAMSDGLHVPDRADGMGCFDLGDNKVALVRNHELHPSKMAQQPASVQAHKTSMAYDQLKSGVSLPGGTTTLVYDMLSHKVEKQFYSLSGTIRNCAGGITPWGSWLSCEESVDKPDGKIQREHGYVFEVPAAAEGLIPAKPIKAMGRFNHEAAAVDPNTGIVYQTEDRGDSLFYRYVPNETGNLAAGGKLQALVIQSHTKFDTRNWSTNDMALGQWFEAHWIDLDNPESPEDDLRKQGYDKGAALFARGEGIHWADDELYFCCTNGGNKKLGQIMRYQANVDEHTDNAKQTGRIQLFLESTDKSLYNFGDNLTVTPQGHLMVCEDQYSDVVNNHLRGVTPKGEVYDFAAVKVQTEPAGACFSPDGSTLFVNLYSPTRTLAIKGPWEDFS